MRLPALEAVNRLPHRRYSDAQLVLCAGVRGQGKTTAARAYIETREPRVAALDPFKDFVGLALSPDVDAMFEAMARGGPTRRRVIPPIDATSREYAEDFFEGAIDELRNSLVLLDEVSLWSGTNAPSSLTTLVLQGRRLGLRMFVCCQRIALVPGVLLSEATELLVFKTTRPRDLDILAEWTNKATAETCRGLKVGECFYQQM